MPPIKYPHTFKRGIFKGETFKDQAEYQEALRERRNSAKQPRYKLTESTVLAVIDLWETLYEQGIGKRKAAELITALLNRTEGRTS